MTLVETLISRVRADGRHLRGLRHARHGELHDRRQPRADGRRDHRRARPGAHARHVRDAALQPPPVAHRRRRRRHVHGRVASGVGTRLDGRRRGLLEQREAGGLHPHQLERLVAHGRPHDQADRAAQPRRPARGPVRRQPGHARRQGHRRARAAGLRPRRGRHGTGHLQRLDERAGLRGLQPHPDRQLHDPHEPGGLGRSERRAGRRRHRHGLRRGGQRGAAALRAGRVGHGELRHERRRQPRHGRVAPADRRQPRRARRRAPVLAHRHRDVDDGGRALPVPRRLRVLQRRVRRRRPLALRHGLLHAQPGLHARRARPERRAWSTCASRR